MYVDKIAKGEYRVNKIQKRSNIAEAFIAAVAAAIIFLIICALTGIYPFGTASTARNDAIFQYVPFLNEAVTRIKDGASLLYSFSTGGGNFYSLMLYYLVNPFNIVALFFNESNIENAFTLIIGLNTMAIAFTSCLYLKKHFDTSGLSPVVFSLLYTFSGFYLSYYYNTMWLSALWLLPLIALGIENISGGKSAALYLVSLSFAIICNFYLGFMLCIFSVLYFFTCLFSQDINGNDDEKRVPLTGVLVKFGISSLLSGGIASITLFPIIYALSNAFTKNVFAVDSWYFFNPLDFISTHLTGIIPNAMALTEETLPGVTLGALALILAPLYLFTKKVSKNEKIAHLVLVAVFWASFEIPKIYYIWHGMSAPAGLPYRFSFLYCFILVKLAYAAFVEIKDIKKAAFVLPAVIIGTGYANIIINSFDEFKMPIIIGGISTAVIFIAVMLARFAKKEKLFKAVALLLCVVQLALCGQYAFNNSDMNKYMPYLEAVDKAEEIINQDGFYRLEFSHYAGTTYSENDKYQVNNGSVYGFNGISIFSSMTDTYWAALQFSLGNAGNMGNSYGYSMQTPVYNSLFDVNYIIDNADALSGSKYYEKTGEADGLGVYKSKDTLGLGFMTDAPLADWEEYNSNSFVTQASLWKEITGAENVFDYYEINGTDFKGCNFIENVNVPDEHDEHEDDGHGHLSENDIHNMLNSLNGYYRYKITDNNYSLAFTFVPDKTQNVFLLAQSGNLDTVKITTAESSKEFMFVEKHLIDLGVCEQGVEVTVEFSSSNGDNALESYKNNTNSFDDALYLEIAGVNDEAYEQGIKAVRNNGVLNITEFDDDYICGTVNAAQDGTMFVSIPLDEGWTVTIDGEETELIENENHMTLFSVSAGEHTVEMKYFPQGLKEGIFVSVASLLALALVMLLSKVRKMKAELAAEEEANKTSEKPEKDD